VANNLPTRPTGLKYDNTSHTLLTPPLVTPSGCVGIEYTAALTSRPATPTFGNLVPPAVVDAGEYVVGVLYKGDRNHLDQEDWGAIDVEKSPDLTITWPTYTSPITYTEDELGNLTAATPGSFYHATISPITGGTFAWENPLDTATVPGGDYSMTLDVRTINAPTNAYNNFDWDSIAKLAGITYDGTYLYKDITIAVNPLQAYNITQPTPASVPYNGYAQAALSALGSSTQGKVQYSADNGTTYTDTIPKFKNAGSYPIEYKIVATSPNYSDNSSVASSGGTLTPISPFVINQVQLDLIVDDVTISDTATAFPSDLTWRTGTHGFLGEDQYGTNYLSVDGGFSNAINYIGAYTLPYNSGPGDPNATMPTPEVNAFDFSGSPFTPGYQTTDGNYIVNSVTKGSLTFVIGAALKGTVNLSPTSPLAGQRLEAHLSTTLPGTLTLTYEWYIGGARVQGPSGQDYYDITAAEVGKQIEVKVTAANYAGYLISISPAVAKSPYGNHGGPLPVAIGSVTATSITFNTPSSAEIYEYSIDGGLTWQSSPYFDGSSPTPVTAGNTFACVQRVAETSAELASTSSTPVSVPTPTQDAFDCAVVKAWLELLTFQNIHYTQANDITAARDTLQARLDRRLATYLAGNPSILSTFTLTVMADGTFVPATASNGNGSWTGFSINVNATFGTGSTAMSASPSNSVTILYEGYTLKVSITGQGRNTVTIDGVSATGTVVGANTEYYVSYGQQIDINAAPYYGQKFQDFQFSGTLPSGITSPASGTPGPGYPTAPTYGISSDISFTIPAGDVTVNPTYIPDAVWVANDGQARILADILADITGFTTTQVLAPSQTNAHTIAQTEANRVATATATAQSPAITGYVVTVVDNVWKPAEAGTASNPAGIDGYLDFNVNVQVANATTVISGVVRLVVKATPWVNAKEPFIYRQPQYNMVVYASNGTANISVQANSTDGGTLEYQWFSNSVESYTGGTAITGVITGASGASVNVPISEAGTHYYYVVITNRNTNVTGVKTATVRSQIVSITVRPVITQSPYMRAVNVKEDNVKDYVTVSPRFGVHWIESRSDFSFTVHANDGYDLSGLTVKTDVPLDVKIEKAPAESDGAITTVTVTLLFVNLEVNVTLDGVVAVGSSAGGIGGGETTGNAAIANSSLRVWSLDRDLYIGGLQQGKAFSVYNIAGKLIYTGVSSNGKTEHVRIPAAGIYLLKTDDKTVKALVK
jgi:hypothetical protein